MSGHPTLAMAAAALLGGAGCTPPQDIEPPTAAPDAGALVGSDAAESAADARPQLEDECITDTGPGVHEFSCGGIEFTVSVPSSCSAGAPCGLIADVHGFTMSARMQDMNTGLQQLGRDRGYIVVQPSANPAPPQASWTEGQDDAVIVDFIRRGLQVWHVDPRRVHATGFSQGGFMTWRLACDHADLFASVAPAAAASDCPALDNLLQGTGSVQGACAFTAQQAPSAEIDILYMHGVLDDNYVSYDCAEPQVAAVVSAWNMTETGRTEGVGYVRTRYESAQGTTLEFLAHDYSSSDRVFVSSSQLNGHCYPGSNDTGDAPGQILNFRCEQDTAFVWGREVIDFFAAHPGP